MKRAFYIIAFLAVTLWSSGCATILTHTYPPVTETRQGESIQGDQAGHNYVVSREQDTMVLMSQPLCREKIQMTEIKRKQLRGVIGAIIEIPLFGLGILDLVTAGVYSKATRVETPIDPIPGPMVSPCGDFGPAPGIAVVVQYPDSLSSKVLQTGKKGQIAIADIKPEDKTETRLTLFIRDDKGLHYVKSLDRYAW